MDAQEINSFSTNVLHYPQNFWSSNEELAEQSKVFVQFLFDYATTIKTGRKDKSLAKLHTKAFDADQIWQQLEYQNVLDEKNANKLKRFLVEGFEVFTAEKTEPQVEEENDSESDAESDAESQQDEEKEETTNGDFFNWEDMEKAAEEEEKSGSEEEFGELYDSEEGEGDSGMEDDDAPREEYKDFFGSTSKNSSADSENEQEAEGKDVSNFQRRTKTVQEQISQLEEEALSERPWHQRGEAKSVIRPENSLLEATLDYERPVKPAPEITPEITSSLESIIRQRVLDENWDDTVRKLVVDEDTRRPLDPLSQEKSAAGLGDIYEGQFLKANGKEESNAASTEHAEIQQIYDNLCWKLDALSNFHFTPKPLVRELDVKPAVPAISMEEVVPMATSDANLKAPEEIYGKKRGRDGNVHSKEELTQGERKAHRRAEKAKNRRKRDDSASGKPATAESTKIEVGKNVTKGKQSDVSFGNSLDFFKLLNNEKEGGLQSSSKISRQEKTPAASKGNSANLKL